MEAFGCEESFGLRWWCCAAVFRGEGVRVNGAVWLRSGGSDSGADVVGCKSEGGEG